MIGSFFRKLTGSDVRGLKRELDIYKNTLQATDSQIAELASKGKKSPEAHKRREVLTKLIEQTNSKLGREKFYTNATRIGVATPIGVYGYTKYKKDENYSQ